MSGHTQYTLLLLVFLVVAVVMIIDGFRPARSSNNMKSGISIYNYRNILDIGTRKIDEFFRLYGFDEDFANAISKPLPDWYQEELKEREIYQRELEEYRAKIAEEFKKKFDKKECAVLYDENGNIVNSDGSNVYKGIPNTKSEDLIKSRFEKEELDEEKATGFYLPGFFEVFPELKFKWPIWARKKDGGAIECETDRDCRFPQACCNHPIIPGKKFCCTGLGQRIMEPAYVGQEIQGDIAMGRKVGENDRPEDPPGTPREPWRPDPNLNGY